MKKKTNELIQLISVADAGNGYIRFSNGLQICYMSIYGEKPSDNTGNCRGAIIKFPMPFINNPIITLSRYLNDIYLNNEYMKDIHYGRLTHESFMIIGFNEADEANVINFSYIAIGKWK